MSILTMPEPGKTLFRIDKDVIVDNPVAHRSRQLWRALTPSGPAAAVLGYGLSPPPWWNRTDPVTIPAGTVFQIGSYRCSSNLMSGYISLLIIDSPERRFMPKSRGGTGKRTTLNPNIEIFNSWQVSGELV